jgi:hypothetical protein
MTKAGNGTAAGLAGGTGFGQPVPPSHRKWRSLGDHAWCGIETAVATPEGPPFRDWGIDK